MIRRRTYRNTVKTAQIARMHACIDATLPTAKETTMHVLDGYPVQVHPGDKYSKVHLFVQGQYVHPILFTSEGRAFLKDAEAFDGPRRDFTPEESAQLRAWYTDLQAEESRRDAARQARHRTTAQHIQQTTETKLAGMEETQIYD